MISTEDKATISNTQHSRLFLVIVALSLKRYLQIACIVSMLLHGPVIVVWNTKILVLKTITATVQSSSNILKILDPISKRVDCIHPVWLIIK